MRIPEGINENSHIREGLVRMGYRNTSTMPSKVANVFMKLEDGAMPWTLYTKRKGSISALSSKSVVDRTLKYIESNELDWLFQELMEGELDNNHLVENETESGHIEMAWLPSDEPGTDPSRHERLRYCIDAEKQCPYENWKFVTLSEMGFTRTWSLNALNELLELNRDRLRATIHPVVMDKDPNNQMAKPGRSYMLNWSGLNRYMELLYAIWFKQESKQAPESYVEKAAQLFVSGIFEADQSIIHAGIDAIRFAIWESAQNYSAYRQSIKRFDRSKNWEIKFLSQIDDLFLNTPDDEEHLKQTWYMQEYLKRRKREEAG